DEGVNFGWNGTGTPCQLATMCDLFNSAINATAAVPYGSVKDCTIMPFCCDIHGAASSFISGFTFQFACFNTNRISWASCLLSGSDAETTVTLTPANLRRRSATS